jgi:hypothetical protein
VPHSLESGGAEKYTSLLRWLLWDEFVAIASVPLAPGGDGGQVVFFNNFDVYHTQLDFGERHHKSRAGKILGLVPVAGGGGGVTAGVMEYEQGAVLDQIVVSNRLDLYHTPPDSGEHQYTSETWKRQVYQAG